jgi:hypothetical protein
MTIRGTFEIKAREHDKKRGWCIKRCAVHRARLALWQLLLRKPRNNRNPLGRAGPS